MTIEPANRPARASGTTSNRVARGPDRASPPYESINVHNFERVPLLQRLSAEQRHDIRVVAQVLPFKSNRYVVDELIDWSRVPDDPMFRLTFPHRDMLGPEAFSRMEALLEAGASSAEIKVVADEIRLGLNPHPAGQIAHNMPQLNGQTLPGMQHKYRETVLFFPSQGQTCHAYCTFCFRWPQFVGLDGQKFAMREGELLRAYVEDHEEVSDVLFTGGDPLIMRTSALQSYLEPFLHESAAPNVRTIRIGTKAPTYWPQRFVTDEDADDLLRLFRRVVASGRQLAVMAHINHPRELETAVAREAIARIRRTGAQIRAQSPLVRHINDDSEALARLWTLESQLGIVPYYLFVERDTGARRYFEVPLERAWNLFREAYQSVSGVARTVRGPSMSATPGKVQILGISEAGGEKVFVLRFLQARNPDWVGRPFFAAYDPEACWLDDLRPAFGDSEFFYEAELRDMLVAPGSPWSHEDASLPVLSGD